MYTVKSNNGLPVYITAPGEKVTCKEIKEDFAYVVTNSGCFVKRKNFLYEGFFPVEKSVIFGEIDNTILVLKDFKIPLQIFHSIEKFFEKIYDKYQSEVAVLLFFNEKTKEWAYCVPRQEVTGAHVSYDIAKGATYILQSQLSKEFDNIDSDFKMVGSIHSHASMGAFHSGTDDKDEFGFDGIHITIGKLNSPAHEYACRTMFGKTSFKKEVYEVVDYPTIAGIFPDKACDMVAKQAAVIPATAYPVGGMGFGNNGFGGRNYQEEFFRGYSTKQSPKKKNSYRYSDGIYIHPGEK